MSLRLPRLSASNPRFGSLGIFSVGVIAFALATLQGCAPPSVTSSSAKEPGVSLPSLGRLRADDAPRAERHRVVDRDVTERAAARPFPVRTFRPDYCQRCSAQ